MTVATTDTLDGLTVSDYAERFYESHNYGYGPDKDGTILLISMEDHDWYMATYGYAITAFTDAGIQYIGEEMTGDLSDGDFAAAFDTFADECDDFITQAKTGEPYDIGYEKMCQENNIELCKLPQKQKNAYAYYRTIYSYLKKVKADIVHVHGSSALIAVELLIAMLAGVPVRVSHSHNTICSHPLLHQVLKPILKVVSNYHLACGELAGKWMYGDRAFQVIPNAFDTKTFVLNSDKRFSIRKKLGVDDNLVIGHIGKFNSQKNQEYLIRAFEKLSYIDDKAMLLLAGNGPDLENIRGQAQRTVCADRIIFWGETTNPESLYSAMDIFALPSRFEGLPVVLLEAQISGLPCIVSDKVTREVDFGDIIWKSIEDDPQIWADTILSMGQRTEVQRKQYRLQHVKQIARYDIKESAKLVENIYECKLLKKK